MVSARLRATVLVLASALLAAVADAAAISASSVSALSAAHGSVSQVVDILQKVRSSVDDAGRRADALASRSADQCEKVLQRSDAQSKLASLVRVRLQSDIEEQEAAVEEATGTTQQVRANIVLVEHTLAQIQKNPHLTPAMAENKRQTLESLQGELRVMLPAFAQLQARSVEANRRLEDHLGSASSADGFRIALRQACASTAERAQAIADESVQQKSSMDEVLKALQVFSITQPKAAQTQPKAAEPVPEAKSSGDDEDDGDAPMSFVQLHRLGGSVARDADASSSDDVEVDGSEEDSTSDRELMSIFGSNAVQAAPSSDEEVAAPDDTQAAASFLSQVPKVQHLLDEVRSSTKRLGQSQRAWCKQERLHAQVSLRVVAAAARELGAEADAHAEAGSQIAEDLARINSTVSLIQDAAAQLSGGASKERVQLMGRKKDVAIAAKILTQAIAIVSEIPAAHGPQGQQAITAMEAAKSAFASARSSQGMLAELKTASLALASRTNQSMLDFGRERSHLEYARESHATQRDQTLEIKRSYDSQLQDAHDFLHKLDTQCAPHTAALEQRERKAEIRALSDARDTLEGKAIRGQAVTADSQAVGLRGASVASSSGAAPQRTLSPLERAAAEMGMAIGSA
mmetsp:Transcript_40590/g.130575  ORF Transcript_40590/g.130575 Transcript_40590/m.130575 type:complete len:632 (+) Transcript_40590:156-2051(+)